MARNDELRFDWKQPDEDLPGDSLNRSKHAQYLTNYLSKKGKEKNYVLNVNASWGAGKTWFLRRWVNEISNVYPVVYIDAWKTDHSKDPFLAVISAISNGLQKMVDQRFVDSNLAKKSWLLVKAVAPEITKGLLKKYMGADVDKISKALSNDDGDAISEVGGKLMEELINLQDKTNETIESFKVSVGELLGLIEREGNKELPLFVFIDELDRCRPTYAIELLETIKHIFDMKNVVFIIATDKGQLQHSIKAVYGVGFDSYRYLDRFFDRSITLRQENLMMYILHKMAGSDILNDYCWDKDNFWFDTELLNHHEYIASFLALTARALNMDLRTVNQWLDRIESVISSTKVELISISFLLGLHSTSSGSYDKVISRLSDGGVSNGDFGFEYINDVIERTQIELNSSKGCVVDKLNLFVNRDNLDERFSKNKYMYRYGDIVFAVLKCLSQVSTRTAEKTEEKIELDLIRYINDDLNSERGYEYYKQADDILELDNFYSLHVFLNKSKSTLVKYCELVELAVELE
ncbi:TPA: KAP family P-loop NTPase fold protein [Serratia fonticola]